MSKKWLILVVVAVLLKGCGSDGSIDEAETKVLDQDTATAASAPLLEEEIDSTLQPVQEITLRALGNTLEDIKFDEDTLQVKAGALVKLTFVNEGVDMPMVHNVVFTAPGKYKQIALIGAKIGAPGNYIPDTSLVIAATPMALPGQTVNIEFTAPLKAGSYNYVCTYPDHWRKMNGILLVE